MPPEEGRCFIHIDFQAAEFRLAALLSKAKDLLEALDMGLDIHKYTYSKMTKIPLDKINSEQRDIGKVLNYAAIYGTEGHSIAKQLKIEYKEAQILLEEFWNSNTELKVWVDGIKRYVKENGSVKTVLGRVRKIPEISSGYPSLIKKALRKAVNTTCQSSCGDMLKLAILALDEERNKGILKKYKMRFLCPVFDALLLDLDVEALEEREEVEQVIKRGFERIVHYEGLSLKMKSDLGWSNESWLKAMKKELEALKAMEIAPS